MSYAQNTSVPVAKTKQEIEELLTKHSAVRFFSAAEAGRAVVGFEMADRRLQFEIILPKQDEFTKYEDRWGYSHTRDAVAANRFWEQACRSRWRALLLTVKAKLVSVETQVETFEEAFLAQIVIPGGKTVADWAIPAIAEAYRGGKMRPMLPEKGEAHEVP